MVLNVFRKLRASDTFRDGNFWQVILLSFSFMFVFTAFQTTELIEETVLQSIRNETQYCKPFQNSSNQNLTNGECNGTKESTFDGSGYVSLSILYTVFAFASWLAPSFVQIIHAKWSMIISSSIYIAFIANFLIPETWLLYLLSALLGAAAALQWTAHGKFLSLISTPETITRNSGVFWAINQCCFFFGNLLVFFLLSGKTEIDAKTRSFIFIPLTACGIVGVCCLCLLKNLKTPKPAPENISSTNENGVIQKIIPKKLSMCSKAFSTLKEVLQLFVTGHMLLLSISSIYSGLEFCFLTGVYSTAVGNTNLLGADVKKFVGLVGILTGIGEVTGGLLFGLLGSRTTRKGRSPIVFLGALVHGICYILIFLNIPDDATIKETNDASYFKEPSATIALLCAFFIGFGDACIQTQLISVFASVYKEKSAQAFAIFKFTQSGASAAAFYSSNYLGVFVQVFILFCSAIVSFVAFFIVEWRTKRLLKKEESVEIKESKAGGLNINGTAFEDVKI